MHDLFDDPTAGIDDSDVLPTDPAPAARLDVSDEQTALFFSATWAVVARVDGMQLGRSGERERCHTDAEVARWARQFIRTTKDDLRRLGVHVEDEYEQWHGDPDDLLDAHE